MLKPGIWLTHKRKIKVTVWHLIRVGIIILRVIAKIQPDGWEEFEERRECIKVPPKRLQCWHLPCPTHSGGRGECRTFQGWNEGVCHRRQDLLENYENDVL